MARGRRSTATRPAPPPPQRAAPAQTQIAPRPLASPTTGVAPQSAGPGLFGQMAATAGGVAVGSAVGHVIGGALTGAFSGSSASTASQQPQQTVPAQEIQQRQYANPCEFEMEQFLQCSRNSPDLSFCESFNDVLKQCRTRFNI